MKYVKMILIIALTVLSVFVLTPVSQAHRTLTRAQAESMAMDRAEWDCACGSRFYMRTTQWAYVGEHSYYFIFTWTGNGVRGYCWTTVRVEHSYVASHHVGC